MLLRGPGRTGPTVARVPAVTRAPGPSYAVATATPSTSISPGSTSNPIARWNAIDARLTGDVTHRASVHPSAAAAEKKRS